MNDPLTVNVNNTHYFRSVFERETIAKEREMFATTERLSAELNASAAEKVRECEEMEQRLANVQVSISTTFYERLLIQKCFTKPFSDYSLAL